MNAIEHLIKVFYGIHLRVISLEVNIGLGDGLMLHQAITWANVDPDLCSHMV